ncbi:MAG: ABC transporter permease, partial [Thermoguttaceae bacterium]|nr:ABC transporter permease [Thermoguttaceae bacterium]
SGETPGIKAEKELFSFVCTVVGAILAAIYPMAKSAAARPLDAISIPAAKIFSKRERRTRGVVFALLAIFGLACLATEIAIVQSSAPGPPASPRDEAMNALLCLGLLTVGTIAPIPAATRLAEAVLTPIFAFVLRFDRRLLRNELSGNAGRVFAVSLALSVGGGLFVSTQIWGYSMLEPFLPQRETGLGAPEAFAAFLPNGLRPEIVEELKRTPEFKPGEFLPVAVEQAAFVADSIPEQSSRRAAFANVVFFGVDVDLAFGGNAPLVGFKFRQGSPKAAFAAVKNGRGVIVTDSLSVDYGLNLGDVVKVAHPRKPEKTLEYPIVGVVYFPGWQWLSKTGGVRRNFGRSGGIAFADAATIADDYQIERRSYFWFNTDGSRSYAETEAALDRLARRNLALDQADGLAARGPAQTAYVKLSTRDSLTDSISRRADSVIWGLSKTPLVTLAIASIAAFGAIANSVRARRWQFGAARAVGLTRGAIVRMVLAEAGLVAVLASGASFTFGLLAAQRALKLGRSMFGSVDPPLILPFEGLAVGFCAMAGLCLVAALYPALQTAREEPTALLQIGRDGAE